MISAAVRSKAVVLLLFIHCLLLLPLFVGFCFGSLFFVQYFVSFLVFAIIPLVKKELVALLSCQPRVTVTYVLFTIVK